MFAPSQFPLAISDKLLAVAASFVVAGVLMATAIASDSPAIATSSISSGVLA